MPSLEMTSTNMTLNFIEQNSDAIELSSTLTGSLLGLMNAPVELFNETTLNKRSPALSAAESQNGNTFHSRAPVGYTSAFHK